MLAVTELGDTFGALEAAGAVVALGHVDDGSLRWLYEQTQAALCPSLAEGFGLPAAEALDFGAPVIVSDDPALQEVAAGRAAAVVPALERTAWAAACVDAFVDRRLPHVVPSAGVSRTWDDVADETVTAVRRAIARRTAS